MQKESKTSGKNRYKPVNIKPCFPNLGQFTDGKKVWKVTSLIQSVKDQKLEIFDLPLCGINLGVTVWEFGDLKIKNFVMHWKCANEVSLDYPVILDDDGFIMDGWHRVSKALFLGHATIKAVRFDETPGCDYIKVE